MSTPAELRYTPDEYLEMERASQTKHEFFAGRIYAMAGASLEHTIICTNLGGELGSMLKGSPFQALTQDMRVRVPASGLYTYPDALVVCGKPELEDVEFDTLLNPKVIFEVLSPSTERFDRGLKFELYRSCETLTDYVLVAQDRIHLEHYSRSADGSWRMKEYASGQNLDLPSIEVALSVDELYDRVELSEHPPLRENYDITH